MSRNEKIDYIFIFKASGYYGVQFTMESANPPHTTVDTAMITIHTHTMNAIEAFDQTADIFSTIKLYKATSNQLAFVASGWPDAETNRLTTLCTMLGAWIEDMPRREADLIIPAWPLRVVNPVLADQRPSFSPTSDQVAKLTTRQPKVSPAVRCQLPDASRIDTLYAVERFFRSSNRPAVDLANPKSYIKLRNYVGNMSRDRATEAEITEICAEIGVRAARCGRG